MKWFHSYLTDRTQAIVIKGEKSVEKKIPSGVPLGSVRDPLLFQIFINDIVRSIESVITLFADNTSILLGHADLDIRTGILMNDLTHFS